jgi:inner membrane protein
MTGRTHDLAAFTALSIVVLSQPPHHVTLATAVVAVFANLIGGIAPDIDQPTAPLWRNLPVGRVFGKVFGALNGGHRFITHSIIGLVLFGIAARLLLGWLTPIMPHVDTGLVWWAFMIGMFSHLVLDSLTKEGVPWLLPIPAKFGFPPLRKFRITTGKFLESFAVFPLLLLANLFLYLHFSDKIVAIMHSYVR